MKRERLEEETVQVTTIEQAVKQVAAALRADVVKQQAAYYGWVVKNYQQQVASIEATVAAGTRKLSYHEHPTCPYTIWPTNQRGSSYQIHLISQFLDSTHGGEFRNKLIYTVAADVDARIAKVANAQADMAVAGFIRKMTSKLEGLAGHEAKVEFRGSLSYNSFRIITTTGASFAVENNIIIKSSNRGKMFNQYPTTFHNVVLADGTQVKAPSEAKVKAALASK